MTETEKSKQAEVAWVQHLRYGDLKGRYGLYPASVLRQYGDGIDPTGGVTLVVVKQGDKEALGLAACLPDENFSRAIGRMTAIGRAMKEVS